MQREGRYPQSLAADTSYGHGELLQWLEERDITPYMPLEQNAQRKQKNEITNVPANGPTAAAHANSQECHSGNGLTVPVSFK